MTCRFCDKPRRPWRFPKSRPAPETCGGYRCRGKLLMARHGDAHRARGVEAGRLGGRTSHVKRWAALLEKWMQLGPREALRAAYKEGYHSGYQARPVVKAKREKARRAA